ncbi:mechanosensitive ion channel family protein [Rubrivirga sp. IMCC43871]|uniref:mechanosensitive ion channel family protein n=1 Tax=Rubrivirga sp. IMCC43871 TaxID=3391575 RepID=UPI0039902F0C
MQPAAPDSAALDSTALADSLAQDSLAQAAADSSVVDTTQGLGRLGRDLEVATDALAEGRWEAAVEGLLDAVGAFVWDGLLPAVVVGLFFYVAFRVANSVLRRAMGRSRRVDAGIEQLVLRALRGTFAVLAAVAVLDKLGIAVAPLIAGLGIAGVALGFAAQDTVQNLIAGVTILLDRPFAVGDNIELDDTFGTVEEITLRTTRLRTLNNEMAILPNANVISNKVINHSMLRALRVIVPFGIAYKESPEAARRTVMALLDEDKRLHPDYAPSVVVTELGDSSVNMELRLHLRDPKLEVPIRFEYQEKVFDALRAAGIEIPFPHLQLFIDEAKAFEGTRLLGPGEPPAA